MRRFFGRVDTAWQAAEAGVILAALAVILFLGAAQIAWRNLADSGWIWAEALIRHLVLVVGLLGGSLAAAAGRHITVDALSKLLHGRYLQASRILTALAAATVCGALFWAGLEFVRMERLAGENLVAGIPAWIFQLVIPYTFASVGIRTAAAVMGRRT